MKKHSNLLLAALLAGMLHHGWRLGNALAGVFAKQKLRSVLLAGMLIGLTACGDGASGGDSPADGSGAGTPASPFIVASAASLAKVGAGSDGWTMDACYKQSADITLDGLWIPIGDETDPFTGTYDGGGNTIAGLTVNRADDYNGLFGWVEVGTVKGVRLTNVTIIISGDYDYIGAVAGRLTGGAMISNCSASGSVTGRNAIGGIAGSSQDNSMVEYCSSSMTIDATGYSIGGVVGTNTGPVQNCSSSGAVKGQYNTAGVVGVNSANGIVRNCYASGSVTGTDSYTGGVVGRNSGTVEYSYATGAVAGVYYIGGIVGYNDYGGKVQNCAAICATIFVPESGSNVGRVAGLNYATVSNCFSRPYMVHNSSVPSPNKADGADVTEEYGIQAWWQNGAPNGPGFDFGRSGPWKWPSPWPYPLLK